MNSKINIQVRIGVIILLVFTILAVFAPIISPHDPYQLGIPYKGPSTEHLLGTNDVGQDILSELIYGTRVSLLIGLISALIVTLIGTSLGMIAGYFGGLVDRVVMNITSVSMAIPSLPITIVLVAYLDASIWNLVLAICITAWTGTARIVRAKVLQIKEMPFIKIEKTIGLSHLYIMTRHVLPNIWQIVFVRVVMSVANSMLTEASLSFLGLGAIGKKSWGGILHYAFFRNGIINGYYWWYIPPILCISVCVLGFMLLGYYGQKEYKSNKLFQSKVSKVDNNLSKNKAC